MRPDPFVLLLLAVGAALRALYLCTPKIDSDQAIYGLMARSILEGEWPIFQWGFLYMGALEPYTAAVWMLLLGPGRLALCLAPASYSMVFVAPLFVTLLSIPFLGERIGWRRALAVGMGFIGVLLVVRPGFRELSLGHLAALGVSLSAATTVVVLRALGPTEKRITLMGVVILAALALNFALMLFDYRHPAPVDLVKMAAAGLTGGFGHLLLMAALRAAPANRVAPAQYSQMIWAMGLGALFFGEFPDATALSGIGLIVFSGLFTFLREEQKGGRWPAVWTIVWTRPRNGRRP